MEEIVTQWGHSHKLIIIHFSPIYGRGFVVPLLKKGEMNLELTQKFVKS